MHLKILRKAARKLHGYTSKIVLVMQLTGVLLLAGCLQVSATAFGQKVTIVEKNAPLRKVFRQIRAQTGYNFIYSSKWMQDASPVSLDVKNVALLEVLKICFRNQPLTYSIEDKIIVVKPKPLQMLAAKVPQKEISGQISDSVTGMPLAGVTIKVRRGDMGTVTDGKGHFTLEVPEDAVLIVSYLGYGDKEVPVKGRSVINLSLSPSSTGLNQLVVVGYGKQKKRDLTGAIASISSDDLEKVASSSLTGAIEGKVPGVFISQTNGAPGSSASVRIRGVGTTGGNQPLYVVDGIPIGGGSMSVPGSSGSVDGLSIVNPDDIQSIEVLKDAAAAAIYGSRAANGVILITTKRGKEGQLKTDFSAYTGFSQLWRKPQFLNAEEFATMANELYTNSGLTPNPQWADPASLGKGTDMIGLIFRNAPLQNYYLSFSGGTEKVSARLSLGYSHQEGTMIETSYKRYTGRATVDLTASDKLHFGGSIAFTITQSRGQNSDAMQGGIFNLAQQFFPTLSPDSAFYGDALYYTKDGDNPVLRAKSIDNQLNNFRILGNAFGEYSILKDLKFRTTVGFTGNFNRTSSWQGKVARGFYIHPMATLSARDDQGLRWVIENTLSYSKSFDNQMISVVVGQTAQAVTGNWISAGGNGYQNEMLRVINGSDVSLRTAGGTDSYSTIASYLGRINYSLKNRYLIAASLRRDGSSNFGPSYKWGNFPAVSAGWILSEEPFLKPLDGVVSNLKIRGSWGELGNDAIPAFGYSTTIRSGTNADNYVLGTGDQSIVLGSTMTKPGNPDLKWETTEQLNIGLDASFYQDKLYLTADYYIKNTRDMLVSLPVSMEAGFQSAPIVNGGRVQNSGLELLLGYRNNIGAFRFDISGNLSTLKNVVKSLGVGQPIVGQTISQGMAPTYTEVGQPIGYFRGYVVDGVYQTDDQVNKSLQPGAVAGDFIYRDVNGDNVLTDADKVDLGKPWPGIMYGMNVDVSYKGFDLNVMLQGVSGNQIFDADKLSNYQMKYFNGNGIVNGVKDILNHWTPGSGVNDQPGLKFTDANGNYVNASSFFVENGAYMRVRNVVLGYSFPAAAIQKTKVFKSVRLYLSAQNLFTFTKYPGFDPEIGSSNPLFSGVDTGIYPQPRTFIAGVNVGF